MKVKDTIKVSIVVEYDDEQTDLGSVTEDVIVAIERSGDKHAPESHVVKDVRL